MNAAITLAELVLIWLVAGFLIGMLLGKFIRARSERPARVAEDFMADRRRADREAMTRAYAAAERAKRRRTARP